MGVSRFLSLLGSCYLVWLIGGGRFQRQVLCLGAQWLQPTERFRLSGAASEL